MTGTSIRRLGSQDLELAQQMLQLFQEAFSEEHTRPPAPKYLERLLARQDFHAIAALRDGEIIGGLTAYELEMMSQEAREMFIYDVAVAQAHRREGIGRALIEFARELCRARGISVLYVAACSDEAGAVRFYEAVGLERQDVAWFTQELDASP